MFPRAIGTTLLVEFKFKVKSHSSVCKSTNVIKRAGTVPEIGKSSMTNVYGDELRTTRPKDNTPQDNSSHIL